ncbi:MAG: response regulator [Ktedonobacteraceae bacterium]
MRFLIIDDSPFDRELIIRKLQEEFSEADFVEISRQADFDQAIAQGGMDAVLVDYALKWTTGLDVLKKLRARFPHLPVLMVTDTGNEEIAAEGMKAGLSDYMLKRHLQRLPHALKEGLRAVLLQKEHKELEEQVRQAQKMESLGLLVGGITHDFNNLLTGIIGHAQLGLSRVKQDDPLYKPLSHIYEAAQRATTMTRQLLTFSRQQTLDSHMIDLNAVITRLLSLLSKIIPENITIAFVPEQNVKHIMGDTVQIEQVIMNLCINACDAMLGEGKIVLKTRNIYMSEQDIGEFAGVQKGEYALLSITDTGGGIDEQVQARMFEPFFTTKEPEKGTGLGLSVVHGIVTQHQGFITVDSQIGRGTTFNVYFPATDDMTVQTEGEEMQTDLAGTETILLVEDDPDVRLLMEEVLQMYGYTVILANDGEEGLKLFQKHKTEIALVIADLMMPKMKGKELYDRIQHINPGTRFLLMSGYRASSLGPDFGQEKGVQFLQKPFDLDKLAIAISKTLASACS